MLTPERLRFDPRERITSSVRSDWSESHTKPMVTICGEFMRTRRILILWPQLLWIQERGGRGIYQRETERLHYPGCTGRHGS